MAEFTADVVLPIVMMGITFMAIAFLLILNRKDQKQFHIGEYPSFFGMMDLSLDNGLAWCFFIIGYNFFIAAVNVLQNLATTDTNTAMQTLSTELFTWLTFFQNVLYWGLFLFFLIWFLNWTTGMLVKGGKK